MQLIIRPYSPGRFLMHRHPFCEFCFLYAVICAYIIQKAEGLGVQELMQLDAPSRSSGAGVNTGMILARYLLEH